MEYFNKLLRKGGASKKSDPDSKSPIPAPASTTADCGTEFYGIQHSTPLKTQDCDTESDTTADYESAGEASPWKEKSTNLNALAAGLARLHLSSPTNRVHTELNYFPYSPISGEDEDEEVTSITSNKSHEPAIALLGIAKERTPRKDIHLINDLDQTVPLVFVGFEKNDGKIQVDDDCEFKSISEPQNLDDSNYLVLNSEEADSKVISPFMEFEDAGPTCSFHSEIMNGTFASSSFVGNQSLIEDCKHSGSNEKFQNPKNELTDISGTTEGRNIITCNSIPSPKYNTIISLKNTLSQSSVSGVLSSDNAGPQPSLEAEATEVPESFVNENFPEIKINTICNQADTDPPSSIAGQLPTNPKCKIDEKIAIESLLNNERGVLQDLNGKKSTIQNILHIRDEKTEKMFNSCKLTEGLASKISDGTTVLPLFDSNKSETTANNSKEVNEKRCFDLVADEKKCVQLGQNNAPDLTIKENKYQEPVIVSENKCAKLILNSVESDVIEKTYVKSVNETKPPDLIGVVNKGEDVPATENKCTKVLVDGNKSLDSTSEVDKFEDEAGITVNKSEPLVVAENKCTKVLVDGNKSLDSTSEVDKFEDEAGITVNKSVPLVVAENKCTELTANEMCTHLANDDIKSEELVTNCVKLVNENKSSELVASKENCEEVDVESKCSEFVVENKVEMSSEVVLVKAEEEVTKHVLPNCITHSHPNVSESVLRIAVERHPESFEDGTRVIGPLPSINVSPVDKHPSEVIHDNDVEIKNDGNLSISEMCNLIETTFNNHFKESEDLGFTNEQLKDESFTFSRSFIYNSDGDPDEAKPVIASPTGLTHQNEVSIGDSTSKCVTVHVESETHNSVRHNNVEENKSDSLIKTGINRTETQSNLSHSNIHIFSDTGNEKESVKPEIEIDDILPLKAANETFDISFGHKEPSNPSESNETISPIQSTITSLGFPLDVPKTPNNSINSSSVENSKDEIIERNVSFEKNQADEEEVHHKTVNVEVCVGSSNCQSGLTIEATHRASPIEDGVMCALPVDDVRSENLSSPKIKSQLSQSSRSPAIKSKKPLEFPPTYSKMQDASIVEVSKSESKGPTSIIEGTENSSPPDSKKTPLKETPNKHDSDGVSLNEKVQNSSHLLPVIPEVVSFGKSLEKPDSGLALSFSGNGENSFSILPLSSTNDAVSEAPLAIVQPSTPPLFGGKWSGNDLTPDSLATTSAEEKSSASASVAAKGDRQIFTSPKQSSSPSKHLLEGVLPLSSGIPNEPTSHNITNTLPEMTESVFSERAYEDLLDKCMEQERLLGFDESIKEEAQKVIHELNTTPTMESFAVPKRRINEQGTNKFKSDKVSSEEDVSPANNFQDAINFDFEYLSKVGKPTTHRQRVRESLFLKFDPLATSESVTPEAAVTPSVMKKAEPDSSSDVSTPPQPMNCEDILVCITPIQKVEREEPSSSAASFTPRTRPRSSLRQDVLSKEISKLEDLMIKQEGSYQDQISAYVSEIDELKKLVSYYEEQSDEKLQERLSAAEAQVEVLQKELTKQITLKNKYQTAMNEYDETCRFLINLKEKDEERFKEEKQQLLEELDETKGHLKNLEGTFNDIHQKYEKAKLAIEIFKENEEKLKSAIEGNGRTIQEMEVQYKKLKIHATEKLDLANNELKEMSRAHQLELAKLEAINRKDQITIKALEESLEQKKREMTELSKICDELINASSR